MKLRDDLFLIPDLAIFHGPEPQGPIPSAPPLAVVEILSPEDSMTAIRAKLDDYWHWGVPNVWLVDPYAQRFYRCEETLQEVPALTLPARGISLTPADIFE